MKKIYFLCTFILIVFCGCEQNITLNLPKYEKKVAVYCLLSPSVKPMMYLNLSKSYYEYGDTVGGARFIKTASVVVTNTTDNVKDTFKLDSGLTQMGEMAYFYTTNRDIIAGKHYVADIRYNGKVINAETTVPLPIEIDNFTYTKVIDTSFFGNSYFAFDIFFQDRKGEEDSYNLSTDNFSFISDEGLDGKKMDLPYTEQIPPNFTGTFTKEVQLMTATKATAKYMNDLQTQASAANDPFAVAVILQSNINGGLGIFGSYSLSKRFLLTAH